MPAPAAGPQYRVEYRTGARVRVLARVRGVFAHHATLAPYASRLRLEGAGAAAGAPAGELALVEEGGGRVVARLRVAAARRRAAPRPRRP